MSRHAFILLTTALACSPAAPSVTTPTPAPTAASPPPAETSETRETLAEDAPRTTASGNSFVAPAGWTLTQRENLTVLSPPEGGSAIVLVDVAEADDEAAVAAAWQAYKPDASWPLDVTTDVADHDGWTGIKRRGYRTSPNEKRVVVALSMHANGSTTVVIFDMARAIAEKRGAQVQTIFGRLFPKGHERESFAGKAANPLTPERIKALTDFVERSQADLGVPGVGLGIVEKGKVVFAGGFGVREIGKPAKIDADTRFIVASNTKAMTTLMLGKLVAEGKMTWETPAQELLPEFRLGDPDTTKQVRVKHLICACTGMPRQDLEWFLNFEAFTPKGALAALGEMQPTSGFGELFQYSNPLAAAAGFIGGHVVHPDRELGAAYDAAMQSLVFTPLGMKDTTLDFAKAKRGNFAEPHAPDVDGKTALALAKANRSVIPVRPAGGAWSTVNDMLRYIQMELDKGKLPSGEVYLAEDVLLARRAPQVEIGKDTTYGMGLTVHHRYDVEVVNHGGDLIGFHSDMMWLPEHGVGAVVLTNGDPGWYIRSEFRRKLLEVLFDGKAEADANIAAAGKSFRERMAAERKQLQVPADAELVARWLGRYHNEAVGSVTIAQRDGRAFIDIGEWQSEIATKANPDGTTSLTTIAPGVQGVDFLPEERDGKRVLLLRDNQHEYVLNAQ